MLLDENSVFRTNQQKCHMTKATSRVARWRSQKYQTLAQTIEIL